MFDVHIILYYINSSFFILYVNYFVNRYYCNLFDSLRVKEWYCDYWIINCEKWLVGLNLRELGRLKLKYGWMCGWKVGKCVCVKGSESVISVSIWKDEVRFCWEGAGKWWVYERKTRIDVFAFAGQGSELAQLCLQCTISVPPFNSHLLSSLNHSPQPIYSCLIFSDKFITPN